MLKDCKGTQEHRDELQGCVSQPILEWALGGERELGKLQVKVRFVGTCLTTLVHNLQGGVVQAHEAGQGVGSARLGGSQGWVARRPLEVGGSHLGDVAPIGRVTVLRPRRQVIL